MIKPLSAWLALGTELEAYDARVGIDAPSATRSTTQWWCGSVSLWLRATL